MKAETEKLVALFEGIGLVKEKAIESATNKKIGPLLELAIAEGNAQNADKATGMLFYFLAANATKNTSFHIPYIAKALSDGRLTTTDQITAAIKYCEKFDTSVEHDEESFNSSCGVGSSFFPSYTLGVVITKDEVVAAITSLLEKKKDEVDKKRYRVLGTFLGLLKTELKWANSFLVKETLDEELLKYLGPKDERDDPKTMKKAAKQNSKKHNTATGVQIGERRVSDLSQSLKFVGEGELSRLHKVGENPQINPELMPSHLNRTQGKVVTRFPPEPNGFLHIGHAKAININFGFAKFYDGITYLRYDDTNPEAEEEEYFTSILDVVKWLGFEPFKVTYSSDHFQKLYDFAVKLIKKDKAYVCLCSGEEIHNHRGGDSKGARTECVHRNRPVEESLQEFENMKNRLYKEGIATLRMKMDMQNPNPQMWDLVAYRVLNASHHRTGDTWCVYPTYDFTHCICDSLEDITHSICTLEFVQARESYYWLLDALELYKPIQSEFGRLNLTNTITSKRKLNTLVTEGHVSGWDDPRIFTIAAIRRRGFTAEAVNAFVREVGVTTNTTMTSVVRLENYVRDHLNEIAPRHFLLLEPLKVVIENLEEAIDCPLPGAPGEIERFQKFEKFVYIDASDFREIADADFFRLTPNQPVGLLKVPFPISCIGFTKNDSGKIVEVKARYEVGSEIRPKTFIQWLNPSYGAVADTRLYDNLFFHENPQSTDIAGGWLSDLNPNSLVVAKGSMVEKYVVDKPVGYTFQGVRVGYFCIDPDQSEGAAVVLNRTVTLKEDSKKS